MSNIDVTKNRVCLEFFPECNICSKFQSCFPTNGINDHLSEMALLDNMENKTVMNKIMKRTYGN